ncbi:MAG: Ada metal-binding domain-containing protein [Planctomycetota bacterium]
MKTSESLAVILITVFTFTILTPSYAEPNKIPMPSPVPIPKTQLILVTAEFTDNQLAKEAGLDTESLRKTLKEKLTAPQNRFLAARQPVNIPQQHYRLDAKIALGKTTNPEKYFYHVTLNLLALAPSESTPRQNRYVIIEQKIQKNIADADRISLQDAVTKVIAELADQLAPCLSAPAESATPADNVTPIPAKAEPVPEQQSRNVTEPKQSPHESPKELSFVASKNSKVFHRSDCLSAKNILPDNLVHYKTRTEAINAGKKPCKRCNP